MAKKLDAKETVDIRELVLSEVIQLEALINILESKGVITKQELLEEIKRVAAKMPRAET